MLSPGDFKHKFVKAAGGSGGMRAVAMAAGLMTSMLLARFLGPEDYGTYGLVVSILTLQALLLHAGMPSFLMREVVHFRSDQNWSALKGLRLRIVQWMIMGGCGLLIIMYLLAKTGIAWFQGDLYSYLLFASPMMLLIGLNSTRAALIRGFKHVLLSQLPQNLVQPVVQLLCLAALVVWFSFSIKNALLSLMFSTFASVLVAGFILRKIAPLQADIKASYETRQWIQGLAPFSVLAVVTVLGTQVSVVVLGYFAPREEVGYFRIAERLSQLVIFSMLIVNLVTGPHLAERAKQLQWDGVQTLAKKAARGAFMVALPITLVLVFAGQPLVGLLFGKAYSEPVWLPLIVLCTGRLINVFFGSVINVLNMSGYEKETIQGIVLGLGVNVVLTSVLSPYYGATGAAMGFLGSLVVWNFFLSWKLKQRLNIRVSVF